MTRNEIVRYLILRTVGNFLLLFAIFGTVLTFGPVVYYEVVFAVSQARGVNYKVASATTSAFGELLKNQRTAVTNPQLGDVLAGAKDQTLIAKDTDFSILIPKIGANEKVFPNVDASNEKEFLPTLLKGVAHAKGTVFPGQNGNIYLFAHSTDNFWDVGRYNAVFYLVKNLTAGDEIVIFFQNKRYNYVVSESKIVDPTDVSYIVQAQGGKEQLILQTCWPPATTWKRLLVFARPK